MSRSGKQIQLRPDIRYRTVGTEGIVVRQEEGEVLLLNEVGAHIMDCVIKKLDTSEIVRSLTECFDVDSDTAEQDLNDFLIQMQSAGVLAPA